MVLRCNVVSVLVAIAEAALRSSSSRVGKWAPACISGCRECRTCISAAAMNRRVLVGGDSSWSGGGRSRLSVTVGEEGCGGADDDEDDAVEGATDESDGRNTIGSASTQPAIYSKRFASDPKLGDTSG